MRQLAAWLFSAATIVLLLAGSQAARAQSGPASRGAAAASPSPSPAAEGARKRLKISLDSYTSGIDQQFVGPGISPPQGPLFAAGSMVAPATPYDLFSRDPLVTGLGIHQAFEIVPTYELSPLLDLTLRFSYGSVGGSANVDNYWGDSIMPTLNPTLGQRAFVAPPAFPTHNGGDGVQGTRLSVLGGEIALHNGNGAFSAGWFNSHQTLGHVFFQPRWPNEPAQLVPLLPSNIGEGSPGSELAASKLPILPLHGVGAWYNRGLATGELIDADLPSMPGTESRVTSASITVQHSAQLAFSGEIAHLVQSGAIATPVLFGTLPFTYGTPQGPLPQSTLFGQRMTVIGAGAVFPVGDSDAEARLGYSCYAASGVFAPTSSCTSGTFLYGRYHHGFSAFDAGLELVYDSPRYAPAILPYGMQENVLSVPWGSPRSWFANDFAFVDHGMVGSNRQGARLSVSSLIAGVEIRLAGAIYGQIARYDAGSAYTVGFVEPYFTPQLTAAGGTLGWEHHLDASFAWHPKFGDVRLDLTDTAVWRAPSGPNPNEAVRMDYPGAVIALTRPVTSRILGTLGAGRYAATGAFNTAGVKNADLGENVVFAGAEYRSNATSVYHLQYRLYSVNGTATTPGGPSPAFHGPQFLFEQLFKS